MINKYSRFSILLAFFISMGCYNESIENNPLSENLLIELKKYKQSEVNQNPELMNHEDCITAFSKTLLGPHDPGLKESWAELGLDYLPLAGMETVEFPCYQLSEKKDQLRGRGFFLFFPDSKSTNILQIPHQYFDEHTGKIAAQIAKENYFRVIAWNTLNRYAGKDSEDQWNTDFAHAKNTSFTALTEAFNQENKGAYLYQIHGFSKSKRITRAGRQADFIISSGHFARTTPAFELMVKSLKNKFTNVFLFPKETGELGATKNVSGNILNKGKVNYFIHIELSSDCRDNLIHKQNWRDRFYEALFSVSNP